ncbi:hypothetical protein ID866_10548 [Astraeus odoratus]|nr:hypothetical protein ID866_10548 [Astraeus odoratus]
MFASSLKGVHVVLGLGLLLRECKRAQEAEDDDPEVAGLDFLLNSILGIRRIEDVLTAIRLVISRLEKTGSGDQDLKVKESNTKGMDQDGNEEESLQDRLLKSPLLNKEKGVRGVR